MSDRSEEVKHDLPIRTEEILARCGIAEPQIRVLTIRWARKERRELLMERLGFATKIRRVFGQIGGDSAPHSVAPPSSPGSPHMSGERERSVRNGGGVGDVEGKGAEIRTRKGGDQYQHQLDGHVWAGVSP